MQKETQFQEALSGTSRLDEPTCTAFEVSKESLDLYYSGSEQIETEDSQLEPDLAAQFLHW